MATTDSVSSIMNQYGSSSSTAAASKSNGDELGKDAFLNLLVTQLQNQDPLNPTEDKDFLAQMAQFSSLEQMQNLNSTFQMSQANDLVGKIITATVVSAATQETSTIEGYVDSIKISSGSVYLMVDDQEVPLSDVTDVTAVDYNAATLSSIEEITDTIETLQKKIETLLADQDDTTT